jgi:DNA-binding protein H-NS
MARRASKFDQMTVADLVQLRDEIETALNGKIAIERKELQSKIDSLANIERRGGKIGSAGNSPERNTRRKPHALKGRKAPTKYRGPNGEEWSGRGLAPRWLVALEKKGKKRDQFLIRQ